MKKYKTFIMLKTCFFTMSFNDYYWVVYPWKEERLFLTGDYGFKFLQDQKKSWFINILYKKNNSFGEEFEGFIRSLSDYIHGLNTHVCCRKVKDSFENSIYSKFLQFEDKKIIIQGPLKFFEEKSIILRKNKAKNDFISNTDNIDFDIPNEIKISDPLEYFMSNGYCKDDVDNVYIFKIIDINNKSLISFGLYR